LWQRFAVEATVDAIGAGRTGIRLSPGAGLWGAEDTEVPELYVALLTELSCLELPTSTSRRPPTRTPCSCCARPGTAPWYQGGGVGYLDYPAYRHTA
jgi:hypothetical protein